MHPFRIQSLFHPSFMPMEWDGKLEIVRCTWVWSRFLIFVFLVPFLFLFFFITLSFLLCAKFTCFIAHCWFIFYDFLCRKKTFRNVTKLKVDKSISFCVSVKIISLQLDFLSALFALLLFPTRLRRISFFLLLFNLELCFFLSHFSCIVR